MTCNRIRLNPSGPLKVTQPTSRLLRGTATPNGLSQALKTGRSRSGTPSAFFRERERNVRRLFLLILFTLLDSSRTAVIQRNFDHKSPVNDCVIHPNQGELVSCDQSGAIKVWDLAQNLCTHELVSFFFFLVQGSNCIRLTSRLSSTASGRRRAYALREHC